MISYDNYAKFRNARGLKDSDVSRLASITPSTFSDWKKGKSSPKELKMRKIADVLGLKYSDFIGESDADFSVKVSEDEYVLIEKYRNSDQQTRDMISRLLAYSSLFSNK